MSRSSKSSRDGSGPVIDAEWTPIETTALAPPSPVARPQVVVVRPRLAPARAMAAACPVCKSRKAEVKMNFGIIRVKVCQRCAVIAKGAMFVVSRMFV